MSARKKVNQSRPRALASDAALDAAGAVCFDATGDKIPPPARRSSRPPSNSNASVDSPLSPAPSGNYGVGFWPMPLCIGPPHFLWRPAPDKAQGVGGRARGNSICANAAILRSRGEFHRIEWMAHFRDHRPADSLCQDGGHRQGRFVVPDLPKAKYKVWARGYGLVDSPKVDGEPGKQLNLRAVPAPNDAAAAQYYPAIHWYTMMRIPGADQFGQARGGIPQGVKQIDYLNLLKNNGCVGCHQLGTKATRTIPAFFGTDSKDAWMKRVQAGQAGELMVTIIAGQLASAPIPYLAEWTDRVAAGELPSTKPARPQGLERNVVVTTWDWADEKHYLHDLVSTDRRNPTVNGYGPVYGQPEYSMGFMPILDPKTNTADMYKAPIRDPDMHENLGPTHAAREKALGPSAYWGEEKIWEAYFNNHNSMLDEKGRVWMAASFRDEKNQPAYCKDPNHPSAKLFQVPVSGRQLTVYDPKTKKYDFVDVCFTTHHLNFAYDANNTLWTSSGGGGGVVGWLNTKKWDETHDPAQSVGWTALIVDTSGDGKRGEYTEPNQPMDPTKDRRLGQVIYAV